jgi:hypothetical protein
MSKISTVKFGILYLLLIPIFAIIYFFIPEHFYFPTAKYEPSLRKEMQNIMKSMTNDMVKRLNIQYRNKFIPIDDPIEERILEFQEGCKSKTSFELKINIQDLHVSDMEFIFDKIYFILNVPILVPGTMTSEDLINNRIRYGEKILGLK